MHVRALLAAALVTATLGCNATVVVTAGEEGSQAAGLRGNTQIATLRDNTVVVADAFGNHVVAWEQNTFFSPLDVRISPAGGEIGFGVRPDQYDPNYAAFTGPIGAPRVITNATPTGDVVPLGGGRVAWLEKGAIRITDQNGSPLAGDQAAFTSSLQLVAGRDGAVYSAGGYFDSQVIQGVDPTTGEVRQLGATEVGVFDINANGEAIASLDADVLLIDEVGTASVFCTLEGFTTKTPRWSPDGNRVVVIGHQPDGHDAILDVFVCERGRSSPIRITSDDVDDRQPVFDDTGDHLIWARAGDLVKTPALDGDALEVLIASGFSDDLTVAWLP